MCRPNEISFHLNEIFKVEKCAVSQNRKSMLCVKSFTFEAFLVGFYVCFSWFFGWLVGCGLVVCLFVCFWFCCCFILFVWLVFGLDWDFFPPLPLLFINMYFQFDFKIRENEVKFM